MIATKWISPLILLGLFLTLCGTEPCHAETGYEDSGIFAINTSLLSAVDELPDISLASSLSPCHPNPFNPQTIIKYHLAHGARAHLAVYDLKGMLVRTLQSGEELAAGPHEAVWNGRDNTGQNVAGGVYLYRLKAGAFLACQRMTLIK